MDGTKYTSLDQLAKGKIAPISELPSRRHEAASIWLAFVDRVHVGYYQEVACSFPAAWHAIKRLEETGVVGPGEFSVLIRNYDGQEHVSFITKLSVGGKDERSRTWLKR